MAVLCKQMMLPRTIHVGFKQCVIAVDCYAAMNPL